MRLCAVDKVLNHPLVDLTAQLEIIHEDVLHGDRLQDLQQQKEGSKLTSCLGVLLGKSYSLNDCSTHSWVKKQVDVFMEESLVLLVSCTEVLQEFMSQFHDLLHTNILTLVAKNTVLFIISNS